MLALFLVGGFLFTRYIFCRGRLVFIDQWEYGGNCYPFVGDYMVLFNAPRFFWRRAMPILPGSPISDGVRGDSSRGHWGISSIPSEVIYMIHALMKTS